MPQVWATFEEIAELFDFDLASARDHVIANQWERRRYSDGVTRAVLPPEAARKLMIGYVAQLTSTEDPAGQEKEVGHCVGQLDECARKERPIAQMQSNAAPAFPLPLLPATFGRTACLPESPEELKRELTPLHLNRPKRDPDSSFPGAIYCDAAIFRSRYSIAPLIPLPGCELR